MLMDKQRLNCMKKYLNRSLVLGFLLPLSSTLLLGAAGADAADKAKMPGMPVEAQIAKAAPLNRSVEVVGSLSAS